MLKLIAGSLGTLLYLLLVLSALYLAMEANVIVLALLIGIVCCEKLIKRNTIPVYASLKPFYLKRFQSLLSVRHAVLLVFIMRAVGEDQLIWASLCYIFIIHVSLYFVETVLKTGLPKGLINLGGLGKNYQTLYQQLVLTTGLPYARLVTNLDIFIYAALYISLFLGLNLEVSIFVLGIFLMIGTVYFAHGLGKRVKYSRLAHNKTVANNVFAYGPEVLIYFSGSQASLYQLTMWLPYFERLDAKCMILVRQKSYLDKLRNFTTIASAAIPKFSELGCGVPPSVKACFYVNNSVNNGHMTRFNEVNHYLLLHGDSDKISSVNSFSKIYDGLFVAGQAAVDRYRLSGIDIAEEKFFKIGRPQVDGIYITGREPEFDKVDFSGEEHTAVDQDNYLSSERPFTIVYAPTWEGYHDDSSYSSVMIYGYRLLNGLLGSISDINIIFRWHPLTGSVDKHYKAQLQAMKNLAEENDRLTLSDPRDPELGLEGCFNRCDMLITDISAVCVDFLHSEKPMVVCNLDTDVSTESFYKVNPTSRGSFIFNGEIQKLIDYIQAIRQGNDELHDELLKCKEYVLGCYETSVTKRFVNIIDTLIENNKTPPTV